MELDRSCGRQDVPEIRLSLPERRRHLRLRPSALSAMVFVGGEKHVVSIRDISQSGVRIANVPEALRPGDEFALIAGLDVVDRIEVICRVAHAEGSVINRIVGAEFVQIDGEDTRRLLRYLENLGMEILER